MGVLLVQQTKINVAVKSQPPPVEKEAASVTETAEQSTTNQDNNDTNYTGSIKNIKLSEGGDEVTIKADMHNKPINGKSSKKKFSTAENQSGIRSNVGIIGEESHEPMNSSVVARKGVDRNSVVPRKGVTDETTVSGSHRFKINTNKTVQPVKEKDVKLLDVTLSKTVKKKPVTSDKDSDDGDGLSFVESSSTGQDYMLTGVLIFVCIWATIFGALFFYKRAGEFWDRRHYRRMDFLVEGMYND